MIFIVGVGVSVGGDGSVIVDVIGCVGIVVVVDVVVLIVVVLVFCSCWSGLAVCCT